MGVAPVVVAAGGRWFDAEQVIRTPSVTPKPRSGVRGPRRTLSEGPLFIAMMEPHGMCHWRRESGPMVVFDLHPNKMAEIRG